MLNKQPNPQQINISFSQPNNTNISQDLKIFNQTCSPKHVRSDIGRGGSWRT